MWQTHKSVCKYNKQCCKKSLQSRTMQPAHIRLWELKGLSRPPTISWRSHFVTTELKDSHPGARHPRNTQATNTLPTQAPQIHSFSHTCQSWVCSISVPKEIFAIHSRVKTCGQSSNWGTFSAKHGTCPCSQPIYIYPLLSTRSEIWAVKRVACHKSVVERRWWM